MCTGHWGQQCSGGGGGWEGQGSSVQLDLLSLSAEKIPYQQCMVSHFFHLRKIKVVFARGTSFMKTHSWTVCCIMYIQEL
jgi:hypothetical protein